MIEVFKTNVQRQDQADTLINYIQTAFADYKVNFDLDDCDHILRVVSSNDFKVCDILSLLHDAGFTAEVLSDEYPPPWNADLIKHLPNTA